MPHCLVPKGQGTPQQDGMPGSDHPCKWAHGLGILHYLHSEGKWQAMPVLGSPWPQQGHLPRSSQDAHCGGSCSQFVHSCYFTKLGCPPWILVNHPSWGVQPAYTFNSPFGRYHFLQLPFGLICSQDIFQKKMDRSLKSAKDVLELQTTSQSTAVLRWNMMSTYETSCGSPTNMIWCLIHKKHTWRLKPSISLATSMMPMVSTQTWERSMRYTPYQHQQASPNSKTS